MGKSSNSKVHWAFLGAAGIARKNWGSVLRSGNGILHSVASRSQKRAAEFIALCQETTPHPHPPQAVEGYQAILDDPAIDAVYLPLPTALRAEWIEKAARAGKHILSEKPTATSAAELQPLLKICEDHQVQFMDGVMMNHSPRFAEIQALIQAEKELGPPRRIDSGFSFFPDPEFTENIRLDPGLEPAGCLGDLGWYSIRFALSTLGKLPQKARCHVTRWENQVPTEASSELLFENGLTASFYSSFTAALQQWVRVAGPHAILSLDDFVQPKEGSETTYQIQRLESKKVGGNFRMVPTFQTKKIPEPAASHHDSQETRLFRTFNQLVLNKKLDPSWPLLALQTQQVLDSLLTSAKNNAQWTPVQPSN